MINSNASRSIMRIMSLFILFLAGLATAIVTGQANPSVMVKATLKDKPETTYTVQWYFTKDTTCNDQNERQPMSRGRVSEVRTDDKGEAPISFRFTFPPGQKEGVIKFSAIDPDGNPSAFTLCMPVSAPKSMARFF